MIDTRYPESSTSPAEHGYSVVPSDGTDLEKKTKGVYVGANGDLTVKFMQGSDPVTLVGVRGGSILPIAVSRIYATGTTATDIVALV